MRPNPRLWLACCLALTVTQHAIAGPGPSDPKAQKTFAEAEQLLKQHKETWALDGFRKADKQDGGHCVECDLKTIFVALDLAEYKAAIAASQELLTLVHSPKDLAAAHYLYGKSLLQAGTAKHKDDLIDQADQEFTQARAANPQLKEAVYSQGVAQAQLGHDDNAKARFQEYVTMATENTADRTRALRYIDRPELVRARMAPPFRIKTIDDKDVSLDDLAGKVVLIDFWATWCGPCIRALPHVQQIAKKFAGQPLVVMSISIDTDETKWRQFVAQNQMTWLQGRDNGFEGKIPTTFGVRAIPSTFTIDADGVLQDQHVGDADIEGKLKKLVARAQTIQPHPQTAASSANPAHGVN